MTICPPCPARCQCPELTSLNAGIRAVQPVDSGNSPGGSAENAPVLGAGALLLGGLLSRALVLLEHVGRVLGDLSQLRLQLADLAGAPDGRAERVMRDRGDHQEPRVGRVHLLLQPVGSLHAFSFYVMPWPAAAPGAAPGTLLFWKRVIPAERVIPRRQGSLHVAWCRPGTPSSAGDAYHGRITQTFGYGIPVPAEMTALHQARRCPTTACPRPPFTWRQWGRLSTGRFPRATSARRRAGAPCAARAAPR